MCDFPALSSRPRTRGVTALATIAETLVVASHHARGERPSPLIRQSTLPTLHPRTRGDDDIPNLLVEASNLAPTHAGSHLVGVGEVLTLVPRTHARGE
jgi:hypothetical protein